MRRTFKSRHQECVEKDRGEDQRREWMQESITFLGLDDRVGLESGGEDDAENKKVEKKRSRKMVRQCDNAMKEKPRKRKHSGRI